MKGYENTNIDLILCKELEPKSPAVCKLTELAEIALGNEKSNSPDFTNLSNQQEGSIFQQITNREYLTSSVAVDNPKICSDGNVDRIKSNEPHSSTSSKTIMHSSKIKPATDDNSKTACKKIVIPERPFKNIGLEEKESITFQKPKTSVNLLTDDNSVSTTTYSDRDDFDFASLSCDEEPDPKVGNEKNVKNHCDSSSSRATAKTFENKSLIMDGIFKNMGTKAKTSVKVQSIGIQKDFSPKADINQLFDELRGDCGTKVRQSESIPKKSTNLEISENMQYKQKQTSNEAGPAPPNRRPKETRKKSNVCAKSQKEITRLQSELGMSQEEIVKLINEGQRKSKRRCATNRPKKLVEMWSSDEYEEFLSTKDIIALIEEKEKQETRKKRKTGNQVSTSSNKNTDIEIPKLITNRRKSVRCVADKEDNKLGISSEIQKKDCSKTNGTGKIQSNHVPTHSLESKGKYTRSSTSVDHDNKHRSSISSELNHKSTINNKKRKVSRDNSDVAYKVLALNRDTKKASKIESSPLCSVKDVPSKNENIDNYLSDRKQSTSRTRNNKDKKYSESKDTVNSIRKLNKKTSTSVSNKKHSNNNNNNVNNQSYKNRRKNQSNQSSPRRKRLASERLYYWSSSSDEDFGKINSSCAQEFDNGEQYQKHGWIVGDSHKKLVTLLAIAKGNKKVDNSCSVKKNVGRKKKIMLMNKHVNTNIM
ncbi:micronuclear linker histone polyprotein-like [Eurosta solidaginis]|uniref:micronuclear linker histone polyprotein-like n=1 Tax=Eurosta solidaginis TaxID=178769 RepID=UPI0035316A27